MPETLVAPVAELEARVSRRPRTIRRSSTACARLLARLRRPADAALRSAASRRLARRRAHLPQARGPRAHRCAQDQQRARPGAARRSAWASGASSPRPAPASTASRPRRSARCSGCECDVYMGAEDMERQSLNVFRMELLGATVHAGRRGRDAPSRTRSTRRCATGWPTSRDSYYLLGSVLGPHPYPLMVREFQSVIGQEARRQISRHAAGSPTPSSPASAAAATRWGSSTRSSTTRRCS